MSDWPPTSRATKVEHIVKDRIDGTGEKIEHVYTNISKRYAVYRLVDRVMIQFADDGELGENGEPLAKQQRSALSPLFPIRGEINGLIDGWRISQDKETRALAKLFDRRAADALIVALQGDQGYAKALFESLEKDVLDERTSIATVQYLRWATGFAAAVIAFSLACLATSDFINSDLKPSIFSALTKPFTNDQLGIALVFGALGAMFSIALTIRARNIKPDFQKRDNIADALLRIFIGAVSAVVIFSLFKSSLLSLRIGDMPLDLKNNASEGLPHQAIVVAFLAGFLERLVGNILGGIGGKLVAQETPKAEASKAGGTKASEKNPEGEPAKDDQPTKSKKDTDKENATAKDAANHQSAA